MTLNQKPLFNVYCVKAECVYNGDTLETTVELQFSTLVLVSRKPHRKLLRSSLENLLEPQAAFWPQAALRAVTYCTISSLCPLWCVVHSLGRAVCLAVVCQVVLAVVWDGNG